MRKKNTAFGSGLGTQPLRHVEVSPARRQWADLFSRRFQLALEHGNFSEAAAVLESAKTEDPESAFDPLALSVDDRYDLPLAQAGNLNLRTINTLEGAGLLTYRDLAQRSADQVMSIPHIGLLARGEIDAAFAALGIRWTHRDMTFDRAG